MDSPRLMVERRKGACNDCLLMGFRGNACRHTYREASVEDVLAWLRQQGAIDYEAARRELQRQNRGSDDDGKDGLAAVLIVGVALGIAGEWADARGDE